MTTPTSNEPQAGMPAVLSQAAALDIITMTLLGIVKDHDPALHSKLTEELLQVVAGLRRVQNPSSTAGAIADQIERIAGIQ